MRSNVGIRVVSEGGLEPPCPFGALAPQASASAYSATRTSADRGWSRVGRITIANPGASRPRGLQARRAAATSDGATVTGLAPGDQCDHRRPGTALGATMAR